MDPNELLVTALRATLVYFFLLMIVRLLGKREIGATSAFDLVVTLMLGEVVDEIIYGDVTLVKGLLAVVIIAAWHLVNSWASYKSKLINKITGAAPTVLVEHGQILQDQLAKERLSEDELWSELRLMEVDELGEVKRATLEPNGKVSVLLEEWAKPIQKKHLPAQAMQEDA